MKSVKALLLCLGVFFLFMGSAIAGPLPAPALKPGVHVYTIPEGFDPPLIGRSGMAELEVSIKKLHFPFYVVIAEKAPALNDQNIATIIDGLAEDWQKQYPSVYDVGTSQIFVLTYEPRKAHLLGGAKFKAQLGFEKDALLPYLDLFKKHVKGTPKDPKAGILEMTSGIDGYLFDQTDPARIEARKVQARRAEEQKRREFALATLNHQIIQLADLLQDDSYLPPDAVAYRRILLNAQAVRDAGHADEMVKISQGTMVPTITELSKYVDARQSEAMHRRFVLGIQWTLGVGLVAFIAFLLIRRRRTYVSLQEEFAGLIEHWNERVANASGNYAKFYHEREWTFGLTEAVGITAVSFKKVTSEVDSIFAIVRAMEERVESCKKLAEDASYFNLGSLRSAIEQIEQRFQFDTGTLNEVDLFGRETRWITIDPSCFADELQKRFRANHAEWVLLKDAAELQQKIAEDTIPSYELDIFFACADEFGIPRRWLESHPLYGDNASDQRFYDSVNEIRLKDPLMYRTKIAEVHALEAKLRSQLNRLVEAVKSIRAKRLTELPANEQMLVDPADDPIITYTEAQREDGKFEAYLQSKDDVEILETQASKVVSLYERCIEQQAVIQSAVAGANLALQNANLASEGIVLQRELAETARVSAEAIHAKCLAGGFVHTGDQYAVDGQRKLKKAERQQSEKRFVNARRTAEEALQSFQQANTAYQKAVKHCDALNEQKAEYEAKLAQMEERRSSAVSKVKKYGGQASIVSAFEQPRVESNLIDYAVMYSLLSSQETAWQQAETSAQRAYEAEQHRQAVAAQKLIDDANKRAEEARRADSYVESNYTSSITSSWSDTSSSSVSTDW